MKKSIFIITISLFIIASFSLQKKEKQEDIYVYISKTNFIYDVLGYKAYFTIDSVDKRFSHDNYFFKINYPDLNEHTLRSLGKEINIDSINLIIPQEIFKNKSICDVHTELSLIHKNYKNIHIVTEITKSNVGKKFKKYMVWRASYAGTLKDVIYTNMSGKVLLDNQ